MKRGLLLVVAACCLVPAAHAAYVDDTPGVTSTTVTIGGTVPITGPAALFGSVGTGADAYFKYVNANGGVNGRKIKYIYLDDAYDPAKTVELTRQLVEQDHVFAIFNTVGTANNLAIRDYLNAAKIPQLFVGTGAAKIGDDFKKDPWTMGYLPSFRAEGAIYGRAIAATKKPKIARALRELGLRQGHDRRPPAGARREGDVDRRAAVVRADRHLDRLADGDAACVGRERARAERDAAVRDPRLPGRPQVRLAPEDLSQLGVHLADGDGYRQGERARAGEQVGVDRIREGPDRQGLEERPGDAVLPRDPASAMRRARIPRTSTTSMAWPQPSRWSTRSCTPATTRHARRCSPPPPT